MRGAVFPGVAADDHEMPGRLAAQVVENHPAVRVVAFARAAVEVGGGKPGQDGPVALEDVANEPGGEVLETDFAAQAQKIERGVGRGLQPRTALHAALAGQLVGEIDAVRAVEPGDVEDGQVEGVELRRVAPAQGVAAEPGGQGAAAGQGRGLVDDRGQGHVVPVKAVDGLQAGRAAGGVVGLGLDGYVEHGAHGFANYHGPWGLAMGVLCRFYGFVP